MGHVAPLGLYIWCMPRAINMPPSGAKCGNATPTKFQDIAPKFRYRGGEVTSPSGLGNPTPTDPTPCSRCYRQYRSSGANEFPRELLLLPYQSVIQTKSTYRPSGALGCLVCRACYKHIAPLGRKAAMHRNSRHCIHRGGEVSSSSGLGNPTPTASPFRYVVFPLCVVALNIPHVLRIAHCVSL